MASGTPSHILASIWPVRSASVSARYGSPFFFGFTCLPETTNDVVMVWFSCAAQCSTKKSFIGKPVLATPSDTAHAPFDELLRMVFRFYNRMGWRCPSTFLLRALLRSGEVEVPAGRATKTLQAFSFSSSTLGCQRWPLRL